MTRVSAQAIERDRANARRRSRQVYADNPERYKAAMRSFRERNRDALRERRLVQLYGLTFAARDALLVGQGSACAICRTTDPGKRGWQIDHDHATGRVRGILCVGCNTLLGRLGDDSETIAETAERCLEYVR